MIKSACLLIIVMICLKTNRVEGQSATGKIAFSWVEALNRHDLDGLSIIYTDNIQLESPNWEGTKIGKAEAKEIYRRYFTSTPDLKYEIVNIVESPAAVVVQYISSGTLQNPEKNTPEYMRGKKYMLKDCTRMDIRNGKISRQVSYFDQVSF